RRGGRSASASDPFAARQAGVRVSFRSLAARALAPPLRRLVGGPRRTASSERTRECAPAVAGGSPSLVPSLGAGGSPRVARHDSEHRRGGLAMSTIARSDRETSADEIVIQPSSGWMPVNLREVWNYRELLYFLTWRDVKVRYKQTVLGAAWAIIQPFFTMVVFSLFFGRLAKVPSDGIPYPIFAYAALVPWNFFAQGLTQSSDSLVGSANL